MPKEVGLLGAVGQRWARTGRYRTQGHVVRNRIALLLMWPGGFFSAAALSGLPSGDTVIKRRR